MAFCIYFILLCNSGSSIYDDMLWSAGTFNDLDHHQVASLASCFLPCYSSSKKACVTSEFCEPVLQLMSAAKKIAEVHISCLLSVFDTSPKLIEM
jgi:ATP-dependent RNA helicase DOB1